MTPMRIPHATSLLLLSLALAGPAPAAERPNVVFVFIDDMGYGDLGCTGNKLVKTTHMDRLAAEGTRFEQFYVASPICSPSRVGVLTGQYPARHRIHSYLAARARNRARGMADFLDPTAPSVARAFHEAGYATAHFGKWHMGGGRDVGDAPLPRAYGFDESLVSFEGLGDRVLPPGGLSRQSEKLGKGKITHAPKYKQTEIYIDRAIDFLTRNKDKPCYLHLWLNDVHDPHVPRPGSTEKYKEYAKNPYLPKFFAVLAEVDRQVGRLVQAIDDLGLGERTLIVLTSDNGPTAWPRYYKEGHEPPGSTGGFRGRKWSLYEGGIRMPLIARWKGKIPAGRVDGRTVFGAIDLSPTFCALAGVKPPAGDLDGEDMSAAFLGKEVTRKKPLFWEYGRDASYLRPGREHDQSPNLAVRDGDWKLLMNFDGSRVELYDLGKSSKEEENVADKHPEVVRRLKRELLAWRRSLPGAKE
jgi:arylsulfatase A-like enzyme